MLLLPPTRALHVGQFAQPERVEFFPGPFKRVAVSLFERSFSRDIVAGMGQFLFLIIAV